MSTAVTVVNGVAITADDRPQFNQEQIDLLKTTFCKGSTNDEFKLFLEVCRSKNLDPFSKQIHAVKRWESGKDGQQGREVMSFQTGIDGFRVLAERTGQYAGQDPPMWCGDDGVWRDVWLSKAPPAAAKATVYRKGWQQPVTRIAKYSEYVQTKKDGSPVQMWGKMPSGQLFKCAEALALRAAFPERLSGLNTDDEMAHMDAPEEPKTFREKVSDTQTVAAQRLSELTGATVTVEAIYTPEEIEPPPPQWIGPMMEAFGTMKEALGETGYRAVMNSYGYANKAEMKKAGQKQCAVVYKHMKSRLTYLESFKELAQKHSGTAVNTAINRNGFEDFDAIPSEDLDRVYEAVASEFKA